MVATSVMPIIVTPDLDRLTRFYITLLGATEDDRYPAAPQPAFFVGLRIGRDTLGVVSDAAADLHTAGRVLLSVAVDDVDSLLPKVETVGGSLTGEPNDMPWGQRVAHIRDPDGNTVNLTQQI